MASSIKLPPGNCNNDGRPKLARFASKTTVTIPVVGRRPPRVFYLAVVDNPRYAVGIAVLCHSSSDISISSLAATLLFPVVRQCRIYLGTLSLSLQCLVENFLYASLFAMKGSSLDTNAKIEKKLS